MTASAVSRAIKAECGIKDRRYVCIQQAADGATTVYTMNGTRWQAAALSRARRALVRRGFTVTTFYAGAGLPLARHLFYLTVTGKVARK